MKMPEKKERRLRLREAIRNYLETASPMRRYATPAQIRAAAKQMEQSNRIPLAVARVLEMGQVNNAVAQQV